ncbi:MAG: response regulator [Lachnospiraceae bacterium]|nr:response regulator [Lachnospiraceae bacterium]
MYWYALVGVLAIAVLLIENFDILFTRKKNRQFPEIRIYRRLLYGIMAYYITDVLWGVLDSLNLTKLLFIDTLVYYVAMACGVLFWTQYVVTYLREDDFFSRFLYYAGRFCFVAVCTITVINFFTPVLFWFDESGTYHACPARHIQLIFQIILLLLTSIYTIRALPKAKGASRNRYRTIFLFGIAVGLLLLVQLPYPFLPLYTIGYMIGTCLLHAFVVSDEIDELLQRQSELAIAANKAKTSFLSNMSHEIRTPINSVLGMNEMILRESDDDNILSYAENIQSAGHTLLGLVNDILDFSKIEAGKMDIIPVEYDLSSVLNDLVNMIAPRAEEKGLSLQLNFNPDTPKLLRGDEIRLKQIITNILTNAVKYTEKGSVTFSVDYINKGDNDDVIFLNVSVIDTGIGIKPEDMQKLFTKFDRIEEKRNRSIEGTGLGMNITNTLLTMMNSRLDVNSVYGSGSVFSFSLEQKVIGWEKLGDYEKAYNHSITQRKNYKSLFVAPDADILMVDDNPMNLEVFKSLLKSTRVNIDTADSGDEGLKLAYDKKYDIIFLDHMMPEKDGIETLHELRSRDKDPNLITPVICLTANAISGAREKYMEAGFNDYLTKPIDSMKLEELIKYYLPNEKILKAPDKADNEEISSDKSVYEMLGPIMNFNRIDIPLGIKNSGTTEAYLPLLKMFYESVDKKAAEIDGFYSAENWKDYTIKVHALKSSARIIGAKAFGEKAQLLENAGKSGDLDFIRSNHKAFMDEYYSFKEPLSGLFVSVNKPDKNELPEAEPEMLEKLFDEIRSAASDMDIDRLEDIISQMEEYRIPDKYKELWDGFTDAADQYDYAKISELFENIS